MKLPHVQVITSKGKTYYYFRKGSFRRKLPDDPTTEEFSKEYWAIRNGRRNAPSQTSWDELIVSYYRSPSFQSLAKGTQGNYRRHCEAIRQKNGHKDMRTFRRKHAIAARDALSETWSKANERVAVLSILCKHAVDLEWIERNPVVDIEKLTGGEYEPWPDAKLKAFEAVANPLARAAYELAIGTGQRIGDCCKMTWDDFDGEFMRVVQEKTKVQIWIYCPKRLQRFLASLPREGRHILPKNLTQPVGKRRVQSAIEEARDEIGVKYGEDRLVPHGWRYNAATELLDAGCSIEDVMSVTGHKSRDMALKYGKRANQKARSKRAQQRREQNKNKT